MQIKVSDYIASFLVDHGIDHLFTVVGGGAMFLNDSFGHKEGLTVTYHHHEQAAAISAEGYARTKLQPTAVCITSGPGGTNALTGCLCAYTGSIPVLFFSGQVRYATTVKSTGLNLRTMGIQEFPIVDAVKKMTKYAEMVIDPQKVRYALEKALFLATHGRPGPVWLDIPLDVQTATIETDDLLSFHQDEQKHEIPPLIPQEVINDIYERLTAARRPVILTGKGLRSSHSLNVFHQLVHLLKVPVVTGMSSIDAMATDDPVYIGRSGITGDRAGNFAVQNSDVLLSIGNRLSFSQIGYDFKNWARASYKIMVDIDPEELNKPILNIDLPIFGDANDFVTKLYEKAKADPDKQANNVWLDQCWLWKKRYPVVNPERFHGTDKINIYAFYHALTSLLASRDVIVMSAGTARIVGGQSAIIKNGQRVICNSSTASMGYGVPASIGACLANNKAPVICVTGDGSFQMNIQELQTIKQNKLPIKFFVINNNGYHSIRMTQNAFFGDRTKIGIGPDSGDLSFPDLSKIAYAYGFPYFSCETNEELQDTIKSCLSEEVALICEVTVSIKQRIEPKVTSKKLADGSFISMPLEDMAPFLTRQELRKNMFIPLAGEE